MQRWSTGVSFVLVCLALLGGVAGVCPAGASATTLPPSLEAATSDTLSAYDRRQAWFSRDKAYHFTISAVGAGGVYGLGREVGLNRWQSAALSAVLVGTVGVLREVVLVSDDNYLSRRFLSRRDLVWNTVGISVGISVADLWARRGDRTARE